MPLQQYSDINEEALYGKVIYLLGSSEYGSKYKPTRINNIKELTNIFGSKGTLVDAYKQVKEVYEDNIVYLCKVTGEHAVIKLNLNIPGQNSVSKDSFIISSVYAHELYNDIKVTLTTKYIMFDFPEILHTAPALYYYSEYPTLFHLISKIHSDTQLNKNHVFIQCAIDVNTSASSSLFMVNPVENKLYGGRSGLDYNKNELYYALQDMYGLLIGEDIDTVVPLDAFVDDITTESFTNTNTITIEENGYCSYYNQLVEYCINQNKLGMITRGIMGYRPLTSAQVKDLTGYKQYANYYLRQNQILAHKHRDFFGLISVCIGDVYFNYGAMLNNHYTAYAGLISSLPFNKHSTNKPYKKSITIRQEFSNIDFSDFRNSSLVGVRVSPLTNLVTVINGVTTAYTSSCFHYDCNIRMVQIVAYYVKKIFDKYLGEDYSKNNNNILFSSVLNSLLGKLKDLNAIDKYTYEIIDDNVKQRLLFKIKLKNKYMTEMIGLNNSIRYMAGDR